MMVAGQMPTKPISFNCETVLEASFALDSSKDTNSGVVNQSKPVSGASEWLEKATEGQRLVAARQVMGVSQKQLGEKLGFRKSYMSLLEADKRPLNSDLKARIGEALGKDSRRIWP